MRKKLLTTMILLTAFMLNINIAEAKIWKKEPSTKQQQTVTEQRENKDIKSEISEPTQIEQKAKATVEETNQKIQTIEGAKSSACSIEKPTCTQEKNNIINLKDKLAPGILPEAENTKDVSEIITEDMKPEKQIPQEPQKTQKLINIQSYLNLTPEQVNLAKANRQEGNEKIKPLENKILLIQEKIERIKFKNVDDEARAKQIERYEIEIKNLQKQANEIRKENTANFEALLTEEQKKLFEEYKKLPIE